MEFQQFLISGILVIGICISIIVLINTVQNVVYTAKREQRERKQAERDTEFHLLRKENLKK